MKINPFILMLFLFCLSIHGCSEFLVPELDEASLTINSPKDSLISKEGNISFWWEFHPDADIYQLQVVSPDFDNPSFLFDTLLAQNTFQKKFIDANYLWRIRMQNEASSSPWQQRSFSVDSTYME
ncbi:MAG: hypothetical protein AAF696_08695 [Bacteroidota bacterium]